LDNFRTRTKGKSVGYTIQMDVTGVWCKNSRLSKISIHSMFVLIIFL